MIQVRSSHIDPWPHVRPVPGWALLQLFEKLYYRRISGGEALLRRGTSAALWSYRWGALRTELKGLSLL